MLRISDVLDIRPGVTAVIGGGGKTTLLRTLGGELAEAGHRVLLCTTTKILPFDGLENRSSPTEGELAAALARHRLVCAGAPVPGTAKLTAPELPMSRLAAMADYVIVEADGAARRPIKAHAPHEPVIPAEAGQVICVVGASGFGQPIGQAAHRPELYAALAGVPVDAPVTPETEAAVLTKEALHHKIYVNQIETEKGRDDARALAKRLDCPVLAGSLWKGMYISCWL